MLISGVLFWMILQRRGWKLFNFNKLLNVVMPCWGFDSVAFTQLGLFEYLELSLENVLFDKGSFLLRDFEYIQCCNYCVYRGEVVKQ